MGTKIEGGDFSATIMSFLPPSYHTLLYVITSAACITGKLLTLSILIQYILEVYDEDQSLTPSHPKETKPSGGEALYTNAKGNSSKPGTKKGGHGIICWNCDKCGHTKAECRAPGSGGSNEGKGNKD